MNTSELLSRLDTRRAIPTTLRAVRGRIRRAGYLRKWVILGALIGVVGGLGAIVFFWSLETATHFFLGTLAGYTPPTPAGEGAAPITSILDAPRWWAIPLIVGLGGLISGIIVFRFAPEAEGHGTDAAIAAFHHHPRGIRARIPLIKLVASAITIGSGGSGGREGPTAQISAGFGSFLGRLLDLDARDARIAVAVGMAAGIGAIFRAPLGGAILGAELLYREDVESDALVPSFIATIVAYTIFGAVQGFSPIFGAQARFGFSDPTQLVWYAVIGLASGLVGLVYVGTFYGLTERFNRWTRLGQLSVPRAVKPAIAGLLVGCLGLVIPGALGTGYGFVQAGLDRQALLEIPLWMILILPFAKILSTSMSIGSGGSGGIFGPGMVVGGLLGAGIWRLLEPIAPSIPADPAPFAIVAMMALFGSVAHAPLAVMLMVAEMTGNLSMLAPAMIAVGLATFVVGNRSIYASQLVNRSESPAHRFRVAMPLMAAIPVGDAARQALVIARADETVEAVRQRVEAANVPGAPVLAADGSVLGVVDGAVLATADPAVAVGTVTDKGVAQIEATGGLDDALGALASQRRSWAPVVSDGRLTGILSARDAMTAYRSALRGNVRQVRGLRADGVIVEASVAAGSALAGRRVADIAWPPRSVLVAVVRDESLAVPRGDLVLAAGDRLSVFADPVARADLELLLSTPAAPPADLPADPPADSLPAVSA